MLHLEYILQPHFIHSLAEGASNFEQTTNIVERATYLSKTGILDD